VGKGRKTLNYSMYIPYFIYLSILETAPRNDVSMTSQCHPITDVVLRQTITWCNLNAQVSPQDAEMDAGLRSGRKRLASGLIGLYFIYKMSVYIYLGDKDCLGVSTYVVRATMTSGAIEL